MPRKEKGQMCEELEEICLGRDNAFIIRCISDWMDSAEMEEFVEYMENES